MKRHLALVAALAPDEPALAPAEREAAHAAAADFLRRQLAIAPFHVRFAMRLLGLAFFAAALAAGLGRPFANRELAWRRAFIDRVSRSSMPGAMLVRLYRSLTLLAYLEQPAVRTALGADTVSERIAERRAMRLRQPAPGAS